MNQPSAKAGKVSLAKKADTGKPAAETAAPSAYGDGLSLVHARNDFYRLNYVRLVKIFALQVFSIGLMVAVVMRLISFTDSQDYFFPVRGDNTLIVERPLTKNLYEDPQLIAWAEKAVTEAFTFGYYDHAARLQEARAYFTTQGFANFLEAVDAADLLELIGAKSSQAENPQVLRARIRPGVPTQILSQGVPSYRYMWKVKMGITISFVSLKKEHRETWDLTITIVRLPTTMGRYGIGINQIIATKAL